MKPSKLIKESGIINLGDQIISIRLIKEKIQKHHNVSVLEEETDFVKMRVYRIGRLFGGPWLGPFPTISYKVERTQEKTLLHYNYFWPEYFMAIFAAIFLGLMASITMSITPNYDLYDLKFMVMLSVGLGLLFLVFLYLDISYYKNLIEKELKK